MVTSTKTEYVAPATSATGAASATVMVLAPLLGFVPETGTAATSAPPAPAPSNTRSTAVHASPGADGPHTLNETASSAPAHGAVTDWPMRSPPATVVSTESNPPWATVWTDPHSAPATPFSERNDAAVCNGSAPVAAAFATATVRASVESGAVATDPGPAPTASVGAT